MKRSLFCASLLIVLGGCNTNETQNTFDAEETPVTSSETQDTSAEDDQYLINTAKNMQNFLDENDYSSAVLLYKNNIKNGIDIEPNNELIALYNESVKKYFQELKARGDDYDVWRLEIDYDILEPDILNFIKENFADDISHYQLLELENKITSTIDSQNRKEDALSFSIYEYAQSQFDILTDNGENYIPEIHDVTVMQKVAAEFNLTVDQAEEYYLNAVPSTQISNTVGNKKITLAQYKSLKPFMSYEEVIDVLGFEIEPDPGGSENNLISYTYELSESEKLAKPSITLIFEFDSLISVQPNALLEETPKITEQQLNSITPNMSLNAVESELGTGEYVGFNRQVSGNSIYSTYYYSTPNRTIKLMYENDTLIEIIK